jgi:hypothetical protein
MRPPCRRRACPAAAPPGACPGRVRHSEISAKRWRLEAIPLAARSDRGRRDRSAFRQTRPHADVVSPGDGRGDQPRDRQAQASPTQRALSCFDHPRRIDVPARQDHGAVASPQLHALEACDTVDRPQGMHPAQRRLPGQAQGASNAVTSPRSSLRHLFRNSQDVRIQGWSCRGAGRAKGPLLGQLGHNNSPDEAR